MRILLITPNDSALNDRWKKKEGVPGGENGILWRAGVGSTCQLWHHAGASSKDEQSFIQ